MLGPAAEVGLGGAAGVCDVEPSGGTEFTYVLVEAGGVADDVVFGYGGPPAEEEPDSTEDDAVVVDDAEPPPAGTVVSVPVPIGVATPSVMV